MEDNNKKIKNTWLYDTGSSAHISNNKDNFIQLSYKEDLESVLTGKGYIKPIGIGTIKLLIL